jgi:hypothetical protein
MPLLQLPIRLDVALAAAVSEQARTTIEVSPVPAWLCAIAVDDVFVDVPRSEGAQRLTTADRCQKGRHTAHQP